MLNWLGFGNMMVRVTTLHLCEMKKVLTFSFFFILLLSCNGVEQEYETLYPVFSKNRTIVRDSYAEKKIEQVMRPDFISRIGNKILVLSSAADTIVHVYGLDMSYIGKWGPKGSGPDEISNFAMFCKGDSEEGDLYLWGFSPVGIRKFRGNGDTSFVKSGDIGLPYYDTFNYMSLSGDSAFYYFDIDKLLIKKINLNSLKEEDIELEADSDNRSSAYYTNRGTMDTNADYLVYAYMYKNQIDIYDKIGLQLKTKLITEGKGADMERYDLRRYYVNVVVTDKYIYAYKLDEQKRHLLEIYDLEGNAVLKNILEKPVPLYAVDESNKSIIGFNYDDEDFSFLYRFPELD